MGTLSAITAGLQLLMPLLSNKENKNINPYTDDQINQLKQALTDAMSQYTNYSGKVGQVNNQIQSTEGNIQGISNQIGNLKQPGVNDFYDQWLQNVPGYKEVASSVANDSTADYGRSVDEQARLEQQQALDQASNAYAGKGAYSGAAMAALGQGAARPIADASVKKDEARAGIYSNSFNQLAGQGQGIAAQNQEESFNNALQALIQQLNGQNSVGRLQQGESANWSNLANTSASLANQAQAGLTSYGQPMMQTQDSNPFAAKLAQGSLNAYNFYKDPTNGLNGYNGADVLQKILDALANPKKSTYNYTRKLNS